MEDNPERDGFRQREIGEAGDVSFQAVSKHKTFLVSSAKLLNESEDGLILPEGISPSEWRAGDITKGLPTPEQVKEWWTPPDGGGPRGHRGQPFGNGSNPDTYADPSVHGERGQLVDTSTGNPEGNGRGHVHGLSTEAVDSENGIGKPHQGNGDTLSTVSTGVDGGEERSPITRVVNVRSDEPYDVYIGRTHPGSGLEQSDWHNPFKIGVDGTREEVIEKFENYLTQDREDLMARLPELRGKTLACWCKPSDCHGDVLARLADSPVPIRRGGRPKEGGASESIM